MAEIVLFYPEMKHNVFTGNAVVPYSLLCTAAPLVQKGYDVTIVDQDSYVDINWKKNLEKSITRDTICIGISSMSGYQIRGSVNMSRYVKEKFDIPVVWGGTHPTILPEQTLENNFVDIVVEGEGEETFLELVEAIKNKRSVKDINGIHYKQNGQIISNPRREFIDLNKLGSIPYHLVDIEKYIKPSSFAMPGTKRVLYMFSSRGCPGRCRFCDNMYLTKKRWRAFSSERFLENLEYAVKTFKLDGIIIMDPEFFVNKERVSEICKGIIKRQLNISWHSHCRADFLVGYEDSFLKLVKESGCRNLAVGVESGSPKMLDFIEKGIELSDVFTAIEKLENHKIMGTFYFMVGFPKETRDDVILTYQFMKKISSSNSRTCLPLVGFYTPYPGTALYGEIIKEGFKQPQKLEEWEDFDYSEPTWLNRTAPKYAKWLKKSRFINFVIIGTPPWISWWFKLRRAMLYEGPLPEKIIFDFILKFLKRKFRLSGPLADKFTKVLESWLENKETHSRTGANTDWEN